MFMAKDSDDYTYFCMDELAIFCCFALFVKMQVELPYNNTFHELKTAELEPISKKLSFLVEKLCDLPTLVGFSKLISPLLDLVLEGEVDAKALQGYIDTTFKETPKVKKAKSLKREAETQTEDLLDLVKEDEIKQSEGNKRQKQDD
jgi:hypothetical protein